MHVHVESPRLYTSDDLIEDIIHLRQARRGNVKVRRLLTTKRTFSPAVLALLFRKVLGVKSGQEGEYKGTPGCLLVA